MKRLVGASCLTMEPDWSGFYGRIRNSQLTAGLLAWMEKSMRARRYSSLQEAGQTVFC